MIINIEATKTKTEIEEINIEIKIE